MNKIARLVLETYIRENKRVLTPEELGLANNEILLRKDIVFVTVYRYGTVIASSGRVHLKRANSLLELIENTLLLTADPRFAEAIKGIDDMRETLFRVDMISQEQRRVISLVDDLDITRSGLILIAQEMGKLGVLLPRMSSLATNPDDIFFLTCKKAGVDPSTIRPEEYVLYAIESTVWSDF